MTNTTYRRLRPMTATQWPNKLGWTVTTQSGAPRFEFWSDRGAITRLADDDSPCGSRGTHYVTLGRGDYPNTAEKIAELCQLLWRDRRDQWAPCEG